MKCFLKLGLFVVLLLPCAWVDQNGRSAACNTRPTCSGATGCTTPTDIDDCVMCCIVRDGEGMTACRDCCGRGFTEGSAEWRSCNNICETNLDDYIARAGGSGAITS